ncbi:MAG TPA: acetolactate synthase small subunit [Candidatus Methylomirabilis sp.]|jgi:acetolactate synthase-1/3 small subunit
MNGNGVSGPRAHTLILQVENRLGVLARIAGLIAAKGYNIDSLSVAETLDPTLSQITLVVHGTESAIEQTVKQLNRLVDVVKVVDLTDEAHVEREMVLIRVNAEPANRAEALRTADIFRAKVVDVTPRAYVFEVTGDEEKIEAFIELLRPLGIQDVVRTGKVAIARGSKAVTRREARAARRPAEERGREREDQRAEDDAAVLPS